MSHCHLSSNERSQRMQVAFFHSPLEVKCWPVQPTERTGSMGKGGLPGVIHSESGRSTLEGKMPHSHVLGAGAVSRQLLEVFLVLTLKAGVALVKSGCVVRGPLCAGSDEQRTSVGDLLHTSVGGAALSLKQAPLWQPRGVGWGGRWEFKSERMCGYLWLIHADVWQKPVQRCKAIILQLKINLKNNQTEAPRGISAWTLFLRARLGSCELDGCYPWL